MTPALLAALIQPRALARSSGAHGIADVGLHHSRRAAARALHQPETKSSQMVLAKPKRAKAIAEEESPISSAGRRP